MNSQKCVSLYLQHEAELEVLAAVDPTSGCSYTLESTVVVPCCEGGGRETMYDACLFESIRTERQVAC